MRNRLTTVGAFVLLAVLTGCQGLTAQQQNWLSNGEQAYYQGKYDQAAQQLTLFVNDAGNKPEAPRAQYIRGLAYALLNQRLAARSDLAHVAQTTPDRELRWRAYATLGTIDYEDGQWGTAAQEFQAATQGAPRSAPLDLLLYRLGLCLERIGRWEQSRGPFQRVVSEFSDSKLADAARRRLQLRPDHYAIQCGVFSSPQNAGRLIADLKRQGLAAYTQDEQRSGKPVQVVLVGRYPTYDVALRELARVKGYVAEAILWP